VLLRKPTFFVYNQLCEFGICHREMDISKRYAHSVTSFGKKMSMNWIEQTLTLAQLNDFKNVIKPRYEVIKVNNRVAKMEELTSKGEECDWSFFLISNVERYKKYPCEKLTKSEELWKHQMTIPV